MTHILKETITAAAMLAAALPAPAYEATVHAMQIELEDSQSVYFAVDSDLTVTFDGGLLTVTGKECTPFDQEEAPQAASTSWFALFDVRSFGYTDIEPPVITAVGRPAAAPLLSLRGRTLTVSAAPGVGCTVVSLSGIAVLTADDTDGDGRFEIDLGQLAPATYIATLSDGTSLKFNIR